MDVTIALILGGVLGFEREWKNKPAGFRTNMIIAGASALLVSLGRVVVLDFNQFIPDGGLGVDPVRMVHAVIVGVSFIGAGTILKNKSDQNIRYLTTAATILMASGIGVSIALKQYLIGVGATIIIVTINYLFGFLNRYIERKSTYTDS
jgi:putative Mg2+ transporter-C (MgtC) family protein